MSDIWILVAFIMGLITGMWAYTVISDHRAAARKRGTADV